MSGPPRLPSVPMSFGNDSPFPPMSSPRLSSGGANGAAGGSRMGNSSNTPLSQQPPRANNMSFAPPSSGSYVSRPPPLPPSRSEALQREQQIRQQQRQQQQQFASLSQGIPSFAMRPGMTSAPPVSPFRPSLQPGMYVHAAANPPQATQLPPLPRPAPSPSPTPSPRPYASTSQPYDGARRPLPMPMPMAHLPPLPSAQIMAGMDAMHIAGSPPIMSPVLPNMADADARRRRPSDHDNRPAFVGGFSSGHGHHRTSSASSVSEAPSTSLHALQPDLGELDRRYGIVATSNDDRSKAAWCKEVFKYVERKLDANRISDPLLVRLVDQAIRMTNRLASMQPPLAEALYLRGDLLASGSFPSYHEKNLRAAFNDFELSARLGYAPSWFRIGRDYEALGDMTRARDAYERGCSVQDVGCIYRMGMANLLGQLELNTDHSRALPLLKEAADLSNIDTPQPSYVYGMLLAGEFNHISVAPALLAPAGGLSREGEARKRIQRAAYLNFAPAQYRMGWLHEYAQLECAFDPFLSVEYYSFASQGGEVEADLALSKWFLCGAEGCFEKNEALAFTFADKAAAKGLPSGEFALAYYFEVGVGCEKDVDIAQKWYTRAAKHGNTDATERLKALAGPDPSTLSRKQHEAHVDTQLQRKRTEAKMLSDRRAQRIGKSDAPPLPTISSGSPPNQSSPAFASRVNGQGGGGIGQPSAELRRKSTMRLVEQVAGGRRPAAQSSANVSGASPSPLPSRVQSPAVRPPVRPAQATQQPSPTPPRRGSGTPAPPPGRPNQSTATPPRLNEGVGKVATSGGIPVQPAAAADPNKKVYETFGEMGFSATAAKDDKDCVIC